MILEGFFLAETPKAIQGWREKGDIIPRGRYIDRKLGAGGKVWARKPASSTCNGEKSKVGLSAIAVFVEKGNSASASSTNSGS